MPLAAFLLVFALREGVGAAAPAQQPSTAFEAVAPVGEQTGGALRGLPGEPAYELYDAESHLSY